MINLFMSAIVFGTVILFGALGEIITEKSGNLNLGVEGIMFFPVFLPFGFYFLMLVVHRLVASLTLRL